MSRNPWLEHRDPNGTAIALPLCLLLAACGGGGTFGVASTPPPPPVTPAPMPSPTLAAGAFPLTRVGTYDLMGTSLVHPVEPGPLESGATTPGEFTMTVSRPAADQGFAYKFNAPAGFLPGGLTSIQYDETNFSGMSGPTRGSYYKRLPFSADKNIGTSFYHDAGYSYVSMGEWEWWFVNLDGGTAGGFGELFFVNGDRTPQSGIPASGTATYDAHTLFLKSSSLAPGIPFTLTADFGLRTIATRIDQDYRYDPTGDSLDYPAPGIHVGGSAAFSNSGTFDIPLAGTVNYNGGYPNNVPVTPPSQPVTGIMDGAFFGPHAEQVGGTFSLQNSAGGQVMQDAFVGQQH